MGSDNKTEVAVLTSDKTVDDREVDTELQSIWKLLREDERLRKKAEEAGIGVAIFQDNAVSPYFAERREGQFGIAEAIIVAAGSQLAKDVAKTLWAKVVWPRLSRRFGAALKPEPDQKR